MSQQFINTGSAPNAGDGDAARTAFSKTNSNFTELYSTKIGDTGIFNSFGGLSNSAGYLNNNGAGVLSWIPVTGEGGGGGTVTNVGINSSSGVYFAGGPITSAGNFTVSLGDDLAALEGLNSTGIPKRTGASAWGFAVAGTDYVTPAGNVATATALQTARQINGVNFDGSSNITITAAAGTLTGGTLASNVLSSSLTSVGTLLNLTVTNPITGSILGNSATATALQNSRQINGVSFDGTSNITVPAAASTLTGATLASNVTGSSLTSVGTLLNLTVTNPIVGNLLGNAATASSISTSVITNSGTGISISNSDIGSILYCTSTGSVTATLPASPVSGFNMLIVQGNSGVVTIAAPSGTTGLSYGNQFKTAGIYASASVNWIAANTYHIAGNLVP